MRRSTLRYLIATAVALIVGGTAFYLVPEPLPELTRAEFMAEVQAGHIRSVDIRDQDVIIAESSTRGQFRTGFDRHVDTDLVARLRGLGIDVGFSKSGLGI